MILPTKHIRPDRALLGVGAEILAGLTNPTTVSGLWDRMRLRRTASNATTVLDYRWFVLALDLLYMIGAIELDRGAPRDGSKSATSGRSSVIIAAVK